MQALADVHTRVVAGDPGKGAAELFVGICRGIEIVLKLLANDDPVKRGFKIAVFVCVVGLCVVLLFVKLKR